jgi:hypothetical protein
MVKRWDVFISHASEDKAKFVRPLARALKKFGVEVWYDEFTPKLGESISTSVDKGLANSKFGLVVISKAFMRKEWAKRELQGLVARKIAKKTVILPVWLGVSHKDVLRFSPSLAETVSLTVGGMTAEQVAVQIVRETRPDIYQRIRGRDREFVERNLGTRPSKRRNPSVSAASEDRRLPISLTTKPFAYSRPKWLTGSQHSRLSEVAKATFVLLLFEQTDTGCWGKSYLPGILSERKTLPRAMGAITGTPFALLAISSYAAGKKSEAQTFGRTESLVHESTDFAVFETLDTLLQLDGSYLKGYESSYTGTVPDPERLRHEAGACLIRTLYGKIDDRDLCTIERVCEPRSKPETYDFAVVCRLFFQVHYLQAVPLGLQSKVARSREKGLKTLVREIRSARSANIAGDKSTLRHHSINQWSTAWYVLPLLTLPSIPTAVQAILINRVRQFFLERSRASLTETSLLPTEIDKSFRGDGNSAFGSGLALVSWRILERMEPKDKTRSKQAQKMVDRIVDSTADAIEAPMFNPSSEKPEGYLGWGAICLGAASVGIRISYDECQAAIKLTKQLNDEPVNSRSEKELESAYKRILKKNKLIKPELAGYVARAAARLSFIYEPVRRARKKQLAREHKLELT